METKLCKKCNIEKPLNEIAKAKINSKGIRLYSNLCKLCHNSNKLIKRRLKTPSKKCIKCNINDVIRKSSLHCKSCYYFGETRFCTYCKTEKLKTEFHMVKSDFNKIVAICKKCHQLKHHIRMGSQCVCGDYKYRNASFCDKCTRMNRLAKKIKRFKRSNGYVYVLAPDHPRLAKSVAKKHQGYIPEHILVMENHLGRYLEGDENIHHKNGIRHDNRIENLELWKTGQPAGHRVSDIINFAKYILERYSNPEILNWMELHLSKEKIAS